MGRWVNGNHGTMPDFAERSFERILIIKPSSLGDIVHALPVLHGLRVRFPAARIDWLIGAAFEPLVRGHPELTSTVVFDRQRFARIGRSWSATRDFAAFVSRLRNAGYDLAIDLQGLFRSGFLTWATGAAVRIGLSDAREGARWFYTHSVPADDPDLHAVERNYLVARVLGFGDVPIEFPLALNDGEIGQARRMIAQTRGLRGAPIVAVVPGARWETKRWPEQRFTELLDRLHAEGFSTLLIGGRDEADLCRRIAEPLRGRTADLAGRTTLREMAAVLSLCDLVVCHDSAPMHLACALRRPLVCLSGPTNPRRTGPYRRLEDVCRLNIECSPCYLRRLSQCPHAHRCMEELSVEQVWREVRLRLESRQCAGTF